MNAGHPLKAGFTAKELLVTVVCTLILLFLIRTVFSIQDQPGQQMRVLANGISIYKSVMTDPAYLRSAQDGDLMPAFFPSSTANPEFPHLQFHNSTDYFVSLVTTGVLNVNWSFFSHGNGIPTAQGKYVPGDPKSIEAFQAKHNAWKVVADLNVEEDAGTPFLISRNLKETRLLSPASDKVLPRLEGPPYEERALIVIRIGGSGEMMRGSNITWPNLNPSGTDLPILRP